MPHIIAQRTTARIEGDFVVFVIGMRVNKPWKIHKWWPVLTAMPKMLMELEQAPEEYGFLGHHSLGLLNVLQYWRSFDHLERYAHNRDCRHWPAWVEFNRKMKDTREDVGIWHETYRVRAGEYEAVYSGTPVIGLAKAGQRLAIDAAMDGARQRIEAD